MTASPDPETLTGYASSWTVRAGATIEFMVSSGLPSYQAEVVRVTGRGPQPGDELPPLSFERIPASIDGSYPGTVCQTVSGSYGRSADLAPSASGSGSVYAWIYPTLPAAGRWQAIVSWLGTDDEPALSLGLTGDGRLAVRFRTADGASALGGEIVAAGPVAERQWQFVAASADPATGQLVVVHQLASPATATSTTERAGLAAVPLGTTGYVAALRPAPLTPAVTSVTDGSYNGKIDGPGALPRALDAAGLAALANPEDPAGRIDQLDLVNSPARPATGHNWTGQALDWRMSPAQYRAVWYHDDDLADAAWPAAFAWQVPADLRSGLYAVVLTAGPHEDVIPFCVRPAPGAATAPLAVLIPTFTYTIYSNFYHPARSSSGGTPDEMAGAYLGDHRELGLSLYCKHRDGSGVCFVSARRPMIDSRPWHRIVTRGNAGREVSGDLYLLDWLEHEGIAYDTITDDDLHAEGAALLRPYAGVVTGGHPEYTSEEMLDALAAYTGAGGNLAYLGGNGFYWVTTVTPGAPHLLEVRRGRSGSRTWTGEPGEGHHSTGEPGGHWVDRGRAPQRLAGVGFCAPGRRSGGGLRAHRGQRRPAGRVHLRRRRPRRGDRRLRPEARRRGRRRARPRRLHPRHAARHADRGHLERPARRHLPARGGGGRGDDLDRGRHALAGRPRGHDLLRDAGRRIGLQRRLHRLEREPPAQRLRQQRRRRHQERPGRVRPPGR